MFHKSFYVENTFKPDDSYSRERSRNVQDKSVRISIFYNDSDNIKNHEIIQKFSKTLENICFS